MPFDILGEIEDAETIATGFGIREFFCRSSLTMFTTTVRGAVDKCADVLLRRLKRRR